MLSLPVKNCENPSAFDKVVGKSEVAPFFRTQHNIVCRGCCETADW